MTLTNIMQKQTGRHTIDLVHAESVTLPAAFGGAGSRPAHDPRLVLLDEVLAKLNELFAGEDFRTDHQLSWVESLLLGMKSDADLREQAVVNNESQFLASPRLHDAVTLAVSETDDATQRMTHLFHGKPYIEQALVELLGRLLFLDLHAQNVTEQVGSVS